MIEELTDRQLEGLRKLSNREYLRVLGLVLRSSWYRLQHRYSMARCCDLVIRSRLDRAAER